MHVRPGIDRIARSVRAGAGLRPGLTALRRCDHRAVRGDAVAGLTVAAYLVPQVLAYAQVAGLTPVTGLWAATAALGTYTVGSTELTTAVLTRWARPAIDPSQANCRLYEATTSTHSPKSQANTPRRPVVPAVAAT